MNQDQVFGVLRIVLPPILSYAAGRGWLTSTQATGIIANLPEIASFIATIGGGFWSFVVHSNQGKVASVAAMPAHDINTATAALPAQDKLAIAAALPEVKNITTTKELAAAVPNVKVTNGFIALKK